MIEKPQDAKLLGGQKSWDTCNKKVSSKLEALGMTDEEATQSLSSDEILDKIAEPCFSVRPGAKSATTPEIAKHIPERWSVKEDVPQTLSQLLKLKFISFLEKGESSIGWEVMCDRAKKLGGNCGLADAVWLLENQHLIPTQLRNTAIILFPGTVLLRSDGRLCVPYLVWDDDRWILSFLWLGSNWDGNDRLVSCKEESGS